MNNQIIKVGIVGTGFAARFHMEALKRVFSVNINAEGTYSKTLEELKILTEEYDINPSGYQDYIPTETLEADNPKIKVRKLYKDVILATH